MTLLTAKIYIESVTDDGMGHLRNDTSMEKSSHNNLSQCHFIHHKSHKDGPVIEPGTPR